MTYPDLPPKINLYIARLTYNNFERVEVGSWLVRVSEKLLSHPRVDTVFQDVLHGYPTPLVRNKALTHAQKCGAHFCVMIDADMSPDVHCADRAVGFVNQPVMSDQIPFLPSALDFALAHPGPCVVGAPYCAGPPEARVLVSRFREIDPTDPNAPTGGCKLEGFGRDEAAERTGFEMVSALPTGLILIDMRCLSVLAPPWFDYEYGDPQHTQLASTEDTVFSRNLAYMNVPQYVSWSSWAAHIKDAVVGRPRRYPLGAVPHAVQQSYRNQTERDRLNARPADVNNPAAAAVLQRMAEDDAPPVLPLPDDEPPCERRAITPDDIAATALNRFAKPAKNGKAKHVRGKK